MKPEAALASFNEAISRLPEISVSGPVPPLVFICGAPRSGTTYLYQTLTHAGAFGCISNLVARFIENPVLGIRLAQALDLPSVFTGESQYGRTEYLSEPHEFGRGWLKILNARGLAEDDAATKPSEIDVKTIKSIARAWQKPTVFKSFAYIWHIRILAHLLPTSLWLHLERELEDNALSLARMYEMRGFAEGDSLWQSAVCRLTKKEADALPLLARCHRQVADINSHISKQFAQIPKSRRFKITFEEFRFNPRELTINILEQLGLPIDPANILDI